MRSYFFPCTGILPSTKENYVSEGTFALHKRLWQVDLFDAATLCSKHKLYLSMHILNLFLPLINCELEVKNSLGVDSAKDSVSRFQFSLYLAGVSPFILPFCVTNCISDYAGINSRDSETLREKLPIELRAGFRSESGLIEAWPNEPSMSVITLVDRLKISDDQFLQAAEFYKKWELLERGSAQLSVARSALSTAPLIPHFGSSLLHIWQGIESIFDVHSELSFRFSVMIAQLVSVREDPSSVVTRVKKAYAIRSKAAHGKNTSIGIQEWEGAWDLLRSCLLSIIERNGVPKEDRLIEEMFRSNAVN